MPPFDWDAGHGPVTGSVSAALAALAASYAGSAAHLPPAAGAAVAGAGLLGTLAATRRRIILRATTWVTAGAWTCWAMATGPWHPAPLVALLVGAAGAATYHHHRPTEDAETAALMVGVQHPEVPPGEDGRDPERVGIAAEWVARIERVCNVKNPVVRGIQFWETGSGYTIDVDLPEGGHTWKTIAARADGLAGDARLPEGCGVEVIGGADRGAAILNVSTVNHLINDVYYPEDYSPLSVNGPAPIGRRRNGTVYAPVRRQQSALYVGERGSGKSNLMNVEIANQCRMVDSITWVIDLNGGGVALKWLRAWHEAGRVGQPPIDWVADTPEKALAVAAALVSIAKARKVEYQDREIAADDDKLPVDHDVPEIRLLNDEGAELFSTKSRMTMDDTLRTVAGLIVQALEIGRAAACNITTTGLRATQDVLAEPQLLKQSTIKIGLRVADDSELRYFFGAGIPLPSSDEAPYSGCGLCKETAAPGIEGVKIYRFKPSMIPAVLEATKDRRPALDAVSVRAAGDAYTRRWDGTDHLFGLGPAPTRTAVQDTPPPQRPMGPATAGWAKAPLPPDPAGGTPNRSLSDAVRDASEHDPDLKDQFWAIVNGGGLTYQPPKPPEDLPPLPPVPPVAPQDKAGDPRAAIVREMVREAGAAGTTPNRIRAVWVTRNPDVECPSRSAITEWLQRDPEIRQPGGERSPYIHADHLEN